MAEVETGGDHRDDTRAVQFLGRVVRGKRDDDADGGLHRRVGEPDTHPGHDHPDEEAHDQAAEGGHREREDPFADRRGGPHRRGERDPERGEGRRVVEQALAAEQRHHPARQTEPAADRLRRHRVRRRDDRTEDQCRGEREIGDDEVCDVSDHQGRHQRQADRQESDCTPVGAERLI